MENNPNYEINKQCQNIDTNSAICQLMAYNKDVEITVNSLSTCQDWLTQPQSCYDMLALLQDIETSGYLT